MTTTDLQKLHTRLTARSTELVNLLIDLEEITIGNGEMIIRGLSKLATKR